MKSTRAAILLIPLAALCACATHPAPAPAPAPAPTPAPNLPVAVPESREVFITLSGQFDGSEQFTFTSEGIAWAHKHWAPPTDVRFCGAPWHDLKVTPESWSEGSKLDLTKARIVEREGRDLVALETVKDGFNLYIADTPASAGQYSVKIAIPRK